MRNFRYDKMIIDDYKKINNLTLLDFIEVCDTLKLPVFEVEEVNNPFAEPHRAMYTKIYENMSAYRKTMPSWSARNYDYEADTPTYYLEYPEIKNGLFEVLADNKSTSHKWIFEVVGLCVVVHHQLTFTD